MGQPSWLSRALIAFSVLLAFSAYWLVSTFFNVTETFSQKDILAIVIYSSAVLIAQAALLFIISRYIAAPMAVCLAAGIFIVANAFFFNLVVVESFMTLSSWVMAGAFAGGVFVATTIVRMAVDSKTLRLVVLACGLALIASPIVIAGTRRAPEVSVDETSNLTAAPNIAKVDFTTKPNVYFIGFESAAPGPVLAKYLKLEDAPLPLALEKNGFRRLKNQFSEHAPTMRSFNSFLSMDVSYYRTIAERSDHLLQGVSPSPLFQIFRHNGYEVSTLYNNTFFGPEKGPYIDHYEVNRRFSACKFLEPFERRYAFYGACFLRQTSFFKDEVKVPGGGTAHLLSYLREMQGRDRPQLLVAHIAPPMHVSMKSFGGTPSEMASFRKSYKRASNKAASNLKRVADFMKQNDPNSIVVVFGDHGIFLSKDSRDMMFFVQDRYAVMGGILPADACQSYLSQISITTAEVGRRIVQCLAGGTDPFIVPYTHKINFRDGIAIDKYLYE